MKTAINRFVCIHGHFYQPPRENAWLEVIELQDSAHPYHDWNERISAECYAPNASSRILASDQRSIKKIQNNYSRMSFNFGPTLLSWMELNDRESYEGILLADRESLQLFNGHGSAIAQVYNHLIMPLANRRDKVTQVIWGIRDFERRFKRKPEGMWLAETAVDTETLEVLAEHEIKFTILAPRQASLVRPAGQENWQEVNEQSLNTKKAWRCVLPSGKSVSVFFYEGDASQSIAFNGLLYDGRNFAERLLSEMDMHSDSPQLVHVATDGETYGHHHHHGDMALSYCLDYIEKDPRARLTNYSEFLSLFPPEDEVQIRERTSWSCYHGVERWRENCGCHSGGRPEWNQLWRKPLREALDWLRDQLAGITENEGRGVYSDPWKARNEYIDVVLDRDDARVDQFLAGHLVKEAEVNRALRLMEMQRHAMLMYTSCGWFFDEVSGIETVQILQYACRAVQLSRQFSDVDLEEPFLELLSAAPSNIAAYGNAGEVYKKLILANKTNLQRVGVHYAVASVFEEEPESLPLFNYKAVNVSLNRREAGDQKLVLGVTRVKSLVTRSEKSFSFGAIYLGKHDLICHLQIDPNMSGFSKLESDAVSAFQDGRLGDLMELLRSYFGAKQYTIWHLFTDEKRKVLDQIAGKSMHDLELSLRGTYNRDYPLINALSNNGIPIPKAYRTTFEYVLNADLISCFSEDRINAKSLDRVAAEMERWGMKVEDPDRLARLSGESIYKEVTAIGQEGENTSRLKRINQVFALISRLQIRPMLHKSQNKYFEMAMQRKDDQGTNPVWLREFVFLGINLGVRIEF
jgi:alpha-amylase/alpha-mannosidase (GH57 family)